MKKTTISIVRGFLCFKFHDSLLKIFTFFLLISTLSANRAAAQVSAPINGITIGSVVPDVFWSYPFQGEGDEQILMSHFKGKLIILDFWATWCSPCIAMIPKTDSLQKIFDKQLQIVSVAYQDKKTVAPFLSKLEQQQGRRFDIHGIIGDKFLGQLFPHKALPHYVWIDGNGKVVAITDYSAVTASSVHKLLEKPHSGLPLKDELLISGQRGVPSAKIADDNFLFLSSLKGYQEGAASEYKTEWINDSTAFRLRIVNLSPLNLFWYAYSTPVFEAKKYMRYEIADTSAFTIRSRGQATRDWVRKHGLTYELIVPKSRLGEYWKLIQMDLVRMFPQYTLEKGKELRNVLVLRRKGNGASFASRSGTYSMKGSAVGIEMKGGSFEVLANNLDKFWLQSLKTPILDETGYKGRVDIKIDGNMVDVLSINHSLSTYGLELAEAKRMVEVFVIHDTKTK